MGSAGPLESCNWFPSALNSCTSLQLTGSLGCPSPMSLTSCTEVAFCALPLGTRPLGILVTRTKMGPTKQLESYFCLMKRVRRAPDCLQSESPLRLLSATSLAQVLLRRGSSCSRCVLEALLHQRVRCLDDRCQSAKPVSSLGLVPLQDFAFALAGGPVAGSADPASTSAVPAASSDTIVRMRMSE